jgi:hypothetical protein
MSSDDREKPRANWFDGMDRAREEAYNVYRKCDDMGISLYQAINPHPDAVQLHHIACEYHEYFAPYAETGISLPDWGAEIGTVRVPVEGVYDAGASNHFGEIDRGASDATLDWETIPVSCQNIVDEWLHGKRIVVQFSADNGQRLESVVYDVYLPPYLCHHLRAKLNTVRARLDWLPDPGEPETADEPTQAPAHVRENAPAYQEGYE